MLEKKYLEIAKLIQADIASKKWQKKLPGIYALAKHYSVAPATVSKAVKILSQKGQITIQGTKGTYISTHVKIRPSYHVIGEVGLVHNKGGDNELIKMESEAARHDMKILTIGTSIELANTSPAFYAHLPVDGLLFTNSMLRKPIAVALRQEGIPFVSLNRVFDIEGVDWVDYDSPKALKDALAVLSAQGHKRIAVVGFKQDYTGLFNELRAIHSSFCEERKVDATSLWYEVATNTEFWYLHGENYYEMYGSQSCKALMNKSQPPTAAVILADTIAKSFAETLMSITNLKLPDEFPIITITTSQNNSHQKMSYFYGVIPLPSMERTVKAMDILFKKINTDKILPPVEVLLPMQISLTNKTDQ
ncbi:MAG: GntR family transcriptional regulator [Phycisphaerales bacterium]